MADYVCECGKHFDKNSSYIGHTSHCKVHLGEERYLENLVKYQAALILASEASKSSHTLESCQKQSQTRIQKFQTGVLFKDQDAFEQLLINYRIPYIREYPIKEIHKIKYRLDFLVDNKIDLEIDGKSHLAIKEKDATRNRYLEEQGYLIYRINVYKQDNYNKLFNEFLDWYSRYKADMNSVSSKF